MSGLLPVAVLDSLVIHDTSTALYHSSGSCYCHHVPAEGLHFSALVCLSQSAHLAALALCLIASTQQVITFKSGRFGC